ncbi:helix-turn-helix domain-containing protein [Planctomycetota bacterium]
MKKQIEGIESQLRLAITEAKLSRHRLSQLSGVDRAQLSYFVQGKRTLTLRSAEKIAAVLGLELKPIEERYIRNGKAKKKKSKKKTI